MNFLKLFPFSSPFEYTQPPKAHLQVVKQHLSAAGLEKPSLWEASGLQLGELDLGSKG